MRSEVLDNLRSIEGRRTRLFSNAEAAIAEMLALILPLMFFNRARRERRRDEKIAYEACEDLVCLSSAHNPKMGSLAELDQKELD